MDECSVGFLIEESLHCSNVLDQCDQIGIFKFSYKSSPKIGIATFWASLITLLSKYNCWKNIGAVVVAQLVEQSFLTPEVRSLNPFIGKISIGHLFTVNSIEKTKI